MSEATDQKVTDLTRKNGKQAQEEQTITLSTGVVLKGKMVPPLGFVTVMAAFPRPKPPLWKDPMIGRMMENPDDPDYRERVRSWQTEYSEATLNVMIVYGTEIVNVPKGFPKPGDKKWLQKYLMTGLPSHDENDDWRYLTWMKFEAALNAEDLNKIKEVVGKLSGVTETDVQAAESFPGGDAQDR